MITLKTSRQIDQMRRAGRVVAEAHRLVRRMLRPGVTTAELDAAVERYFQQQGATPLFKGVGGTVPFPAVTCISVNEQLVHGIPSRRALAAGDIVTLDTGCRCDGWCADAAWTYPVGEVDAVKRRLLAVGRAALELGIWEMGRRLWWSEVAMAMSRRIRQAGFTLVEGFVGHGIGREMHEDPQVPNHADRHTRRNDFRLRPGLVLAIEPMITAGSKKFSVAADHWTVSAVDAAPNAHFEQTVALTESGPLVLTEGVARDN